MARLDDVRRRFPPDDAAAYATSYEQAALAERVGSLVHDLRVVAGLSEAALAARMGVDEDDIARAEEGDPAMTIVYLDALARAVGVAGTLAVGSVEIAFGRPAGTLDGSSSEG